jgi:hypothetical protein
MLENYHLDELGIIHQTKWKPKVYDRVYLTYYEDLEERTIKLGYQRFGWVVGLLGQLPESVLEFGYGLGTFLEAAVIAGVPCCAGYDVGEYPLPENCIFLDQEAALARMWDVAAFFDVLEHIPDLSFLDRLMTSTLAVAVPYCRWRELGDDWFRDWRMRLPDEHLHHFDPESLCALMRKNGYRCSNLNFFEDGLRRRGGETGPNIICAFFEREVRDGGS